MAEAGLGDGDGKVEPGVELVAPVAEEVAFTDAVGPTQEHEASERSALREVLLGLLNLVVVLLIGFGVVSGEGGGGGSPLVGVTCEFGVCRHGVFGDRYLLVTLVVLVVAKLAVEMQVDGMGGSDTMTLMVDFGETAWIKGVVAEFDAVAA